MFIHISAAALVVVLFFSFLYMYQSRARERVAADLEAEKAAHEISRIKSEIRTQGEAIKAMRLDVEEKRKAYDRAVASVSKNYARNLEAAKKSIAADPSCENRLNLITKAQENFLYEIQ